MNSTQSDICLIPGLKPVDETIQQLLEITPRLVGAQDLSLDQALDRILATPIRCPYDFPPWPASAMDGFAFSYHSINGQPLNLVGTSLAGHPFDGQVETGECVRIMTGAPLPAGTDTVEMQENCVLEGTQVTCNANIKAGQNVRQVGSSMAAGQTVFEPGRKLGPAELAMIASIGVDQVQVYEPLKVGIFTTGDELVAPGLPLADGQIYDSNRQAMISLCHRMGYEVLDFGLIEDSPEAIRRIMLKAAKQTHVLLTSGGVSVGDADYIKPVLEEIGQLDIWKLAIKPGKPIAIGRINDCYFFGLPGNPVSTIVTLNQVVRPVLQQAAGEIVTKPMRFMATSMDRLRKSIGRRDYQRGIASIDQQGNWQVHSTGPQGSGRLSSVTDGNCFIILEPDCTGIEVGEQVLIELYDATLS